MNDPARDAAFFLQKFGHRLRVDSRVGGPFAGWWIQQRGRWQRDVHGEIRWLCLQAIREHIRQTGERRDYDAAYVWNVIIVAKSKARLLSFEEWKYAA